MNKVGIIGGMGPYAGAEYLECFLDECTVLLKISKTEVRDQRYPPHYVFQHPVQDRTGALLKGAVEYDVVFQEIPAQLQTLSSLGVTAVAIACNTAHAWHADLQDAVPSVELIHISVATSQFLAAKAIGHVCLMATAGTVRSKMYARALSAQGIECIDPDTRELEMMMTGIYEGVKSGNLELGRACLTKAVSMMAIRTGVSNFLMACTEIPLVLSDSTVESYIQLYDPTRISAHKLAEIAFD